MSAPTPEQYADTAADSGGITCERLVALCSTAWCALPDGHEGEHSVALPKCIRLRVVFMYGEEREYPIHGGGDWSYREQPDRLIVRPYGKQGNARHEVPLRNVLSIMVVGLSDGDAAP